MRLALIGTGLIGGSAAWAMRECGVVSHVTACDIAIESAQKAVKIGIADEATTSIADAVAHADCIMLAVPVLAMQSVFEEVGRHMSPDAMVTDVGSTRQSVIKAARRGLGEHFARYAPLHPIAGGEMPGVEYATAELFRGCRVISTPHEATNPAVLSFWEDAWKRVGASVRRMPAQEHDAIFASVSHLPHVLAYALVDAIAQTSNAEKKFDFVGAGFRDFTRIAASSPAMWRDICFSNRDAILSSLTLFEEELKRIRHYMETNDADALTEVFDRASKARRKVGLRPPVNAEKTEGPIAFGPTQTVKPIGKLKGSIRLPGSKSISNRALLLAALADGTTRLTGLLKADDTDRMIESLIKLGVDIQFDSEDGVIVNGCGGQFPNASTDLFIGNAGTAARSLTAALAFSGGHYRLDGIERMRSRPIGDLVDALRTLGAKITYEMKEGYPPLRFEPAKLERDRVSVRGNVSSQFLTALLMIAPVIAPEQGLRIDIEGELISRPYVAMTIKMMHAFGILVRETDTGFIVPKGRYCALRHYAVEGDASGASYFLALGALAKGPVRVLGVGSQSLQGDVAFADVLERMGACVKRGMDYIEVSGPEYGRLCGISMDCTAIPDAAMTLVPMALLTDGPVHLTGIGSWRVKETDRIAAMATEMKKFGALVEEGADWIKVEMPHSEKPRNATVDTYDDHRMAMALSIAACAGVTVTVNDPGCTAKTFPTFFLGLDALREGTTK